MFALIAPHSDDECLFAAYTIMRYKPLVIIATDYDGKRGPTALERRNESIEGCAVLGAKVDFLGIPESEFTLERLMIELGSPRFLGVMLEWTCAKQGGHPHHDICSQIRSYRKYATYTKDELEPFGNIKIEPTDAEFELKKRALACYKSQWKLNPQHFEAVLEARSEFYISN